MKTYLLVPVPEDVLRGLGALLHHAGQVHGGALLDEDAGAAQDLSVGLCNETFTIHQNLQIPNFCKDLKTIFQHLLSIQYNIRYRNSCTFIPSLHRILIFAKIFYKIIFDYFSIKYLGTHVAHVIFQIINNNNNLLDFESLNIRDH